MHNSLTFVILIILLVQYLADTVLDALNASRFGAPLPQELDTVMDREAVERTQGYNRDNYRLGLFTAAVSLVVTLGFLWFGGFEWADRLARSAGQGPIPTALFFFGIILLGSDLIGLPFSYYRTFVIDQKYGFNKSSLALFLLDRLKGWGLTLVLGGPLLALLLWYSEWAGARFWLYAWGVVAVFAVVINLFYSRFIVPLFNKQTPLANGSLRSAIEAYAAKVGFGLDHIYVLDGSKRSTKANAYFSGLGTEKRITLYDTLVHDLDEDEIVAVLAHEVGHYQRRHIVVNLASSLAGIGLTLYILSLFVNHPELSLAIGVTAPSFHAALIGFGLLYSPISGVSGLLMNYISRRFEFQADAYAKATWNASSLISALEKLGRNNLSNPTPHPAYVFVHYSHPPLVDRIRHLKA